MLVRWRMVRWRWSAWTINMSCDNSINYDTKMTKLLVFSERWHYVVSSMPTNFFLRTAIAMRNNILRMTTHLHDEYWCSQEQDNDISAIYNLRNNDSMRIYTGPAQMDTATKSYRCRYFSLFFDFLATNAIPAATSHLLLLDIHSNHTNFAQSRFGLSIHWQNKTKRKMPEKKNFMLMKAIDSVFCFFAGCLYQMWVPLRSSTFHTLPSTIFYMK